MRRTKKNAKRAAAVALTVLLGMQCAACAAGEEEQDSRPTAAEQTESGQGEGEEGGQEQRCSLYFDETLSFTWMIPESDIPLKDDILTLNWIRENMNVDIHIMAVPDSDYSTKLSTMAGTNALPDVVEMDASMMKTTASAGMLLNLSEHESSMPDYLKLMEGEERAANTATYKHEGNLYGFQILEDYRIGIAPLPVIRMDLLEKYGIETPASWEELYDAMLTLKEKDPEHYVFSTRNGIKYLIGNMAYSMGAGGYGATQSEFPVYYEPDEDRYIYGPGKAEFKNVIAYLANAYADGLLHQDYNIMDRTMMTSYLTSGTLSLVIDNTTFSNAYNEALRELEPDAYFDMLDPLTYGDKTTARQVTFSKDWDQFSVISVKAKRGEAIVKFFNWLYTQEGELLTNYGVEGETYKWADGQPQLLDAVCEIGNYSTLRASYGLGTWYIARLVNEKTNMDMLKYLGEKTGDLPVNISQSERIQKLKEEGVLVSVPSFPSFSAQELERITTLVTSLNAVFEQEIDKFITGMRSMDDWDAFAKELKDMGGSELEEIYNTAYSRLK